jgi:MurNAc alpha-1-phosphate uridylyltransferase
MTMHAMILAAGRGERMRPLTDTCPKPLLPVGGKPLIVWQIERMVAAGFDEIVINVSYLADRIMAALGNGSAFGARIAYSQEREPLESAGGVAQALHLLGDAPVLVAAADVYAEIDYARLVRARDRLLAAGDDAARPRVHLVLVPNHDFRPHGDYSLSPPAGGFPYGLVGTAGSTRHTWSGIGLFDAGLLREIPFGQKIPLLPFFADWMRRGLVAGELFDGLWDNLGTPEQLRRLDADLANAAHGHPVHGKRS